MNKGFNRFRVQAAVPSCERCERLEIGSLRNLEVEKRES